VNDREDGRLFMRHSVEENTSLQVNLWHANAKTKELKKSSKDLIDISNRGLSFRSNITEDIFLPGTFLNKIEITSSEGRLLQTSGEVKHTTYAQENLNESYYKVGVELQLEFENAESQYKASLKKQRENITKPTLILINLRNIITNRLPVSLENIESLPHTVTIGYFTQLTNSNKFYTLTFEPIRRNLSDQLFEELDRVHARYQFNADGYQFTSVIISKKQKNIVLKLPKSICRLWQRSTLRYSLSKSDPLKLQIIHPLLNGKQLEHQLLDISPNGFSIALEHPNDLFLKNMYIPKIKITIPGERQINTSAQVKYISMAIDEQLENYFKCGFSFVDIPTSETNFLVSYLLAKCHPHLKDAQDEDIETIWDLFYESGFIYEEKCKFLAPIATEINDTFKKLLEPDTKFYKEIILKKGEKCYGAISGIWAYEHTWIIQHLATIKYPHMCVPRDMVLASADFCSKHPDIGYQKMYWRPNNSWAGKVFGKYARLVEDKTDLSHIIRYNYLVKSPINSVEEINPPSGVIIESLLESERHLIESYFMARREFIILQADSLLREEIDLHDLRHMYQQKGLRRERKIYLAKSGQTLLGFVLIEDSSMGLNLSGLLNYFRVYTTTECGELEGEIKRQLIRKAIAYYKKNRRQFAICLTADDNLKVYESLGFKKKKEYMCWTFSQKLAQPYYNFTNEFFARIEKRLGKFNDLRLDEPQYVNQL